MNSTNGSANDLNEDRLNSVSWIASVSINGVLTGLALWILFSLIHYGVRTGKWSGTQKRNADKLNAGWVYTSVVACAVISVIRYMTSQILFQVGYGTTEEDEYACESVNDLLFVEYSLVLFCNYIFLWLRQRTFYTNEMFNINYNTSLRFLSASSIGILFLAGIGVVVVNTLPVNYPSSMEGCVYGPDSEVVDIWSWALCAIVLVIGQVLLLSLLIYPLAKNLEKGHCIKQLCCFWCNEKANEKSVVKFTKHSDASPSFSTLSDVVSGHSPGNSPRVYHSPPLKKHTSCKNVTRSKSSRRSSTTVKKIMVRTLVIGCITVFTDLFLIAILSTNLLDHSKPSLRRVSVTLYDINVFVNLMLVVVSFMTWKKMLTSPCRSKVTNREDHSSRISASSNS